MAWYRMHEGANADPKWPVIARKANTNVGTVVSIWVALLDHASQNQDRGSIAGFDCETIDALYGYDNGVAEAVLLAMQDKGLVVDGRLANWEKRQPEREDNSAAQRSRDWRNKRRMQQSETQCNADATQCNADETQCNADETQCNADATQCNAPETQCNADETQCNAPDKIRIDKNIKINTAFSGAKAENSFPENAEKQKGKKSKSPPAEPYYRTGKGKYLTGKRLESFKRFWSAFDFTRGKAEAADAWLNIPNLTDELVEIICSAATQEANGRDRLINKGQTPKWAQGWLNTRRWEDYEPQKQEDLQADLANRFPQAASLPEPLSEEEWLKAKLAREKLEALRKRAMGGTGT